MKERTINIGFKASVCVAGIGFVFSFFDPRGGVREV